ncbi:AzlD domain-containing protein [Verticiella sediminum]|uniref:AzlD domain-containing protein n=1 Tax=Verticiella sediminum TaxID=1247510 RepID=A0A556AF49_9BURK|nr:AzlD domain-containing protein [Verticiella sediminum]TSH91507.1 AzlD domain-containing protein [Verticiella sediminum]
MSQVSYWILGVAVMGAITFSLRAFPLIAYRWLAHSRLIEALNRRLPLCVMVVLLLHSLEGSPAQPGMLASELLSLAIVAVVYLRLRNPLIGVVVGVAVLNLTQAVLGG